MDVKLIATKLNEPGEEVEIGVLRTFNTTKNAKEYIANHTQDITDDPEIYAIYIK